MGIRLDIWLVEKNGFVSRERARRAIEGGYVSINGKIQSKPSCQVGPADEVNALDPLNYVSAGGLKMEKAIRDFNLDLSGKKVLDIGASTGGFTDCALQHGATVVYTVDVGTAQLHPSLASHPKVYALENKDFRNLTPDEVGQQLFDLIMIDVSFISLEHIFPGLRIFLTAQGQIVTLIKPQFEAGKQKVGKRGIVKEKETHIEIITKIFCLASANQFFPVALSYAPLFKEKNIEYLCLYAHTPKPLPSVNACVEEAFVLLSRLK